MKKQLSFFFFVVALLFSFVTRAQQALPYTENFNSYTDATGKNISTNNVVPTNYTLGTNTMPTGWVVTGMDRSRNTATPAAFLTSSSTYAVSGNCLFVKADSYKKIYFALPQMAQSIDKLQISFKAKNRNSSGVKAKISVGMGMFNNGSPTVVQTFDLTTTYATYTHSFTQDVVGYNQFIYIIVTDGLNDYVSIDDVQVSVAGSEPQTPTGFTGTVVGTCSVDNSNISPLKSSDHTYGSMVWSIYSSAEIGFTTAKSITKLGYYYTGCNNRTCNDVKTVPIKIYMGTTSLTKFNLSRDTISRASMQLVYSGTPHFIFDDWSDIELSTPFTYNPSDGNLVILVVRKQNMPDFERSYYFCSSKVTGSTAYSYTTTGSSYTYPLITDDRANIRLTTSSSVAPVTQYTITVVSANSAMGTVAGSGRYNQNASATITATPNTGYIFKRWSDGNTSNPRTVTVTGDATYTAEFEAATMYTLAASSADAAMGTVSGSGSYASGTTVSMTASPYSHYRFLRWNDGITSNPRSFVITCDTTFTATFAPEQYTLTVVANDASFGTVTGGGTYDYNSQVTLNATANDGYHFVNWSDGSTENPHTVVVTHSSTVTANFAPDGGTPTTQYNVTLSVNNSSMGSVWGSYDNGSTQYTAVAIANEGYRFVKWSNGSTDIIYTFMPTCDTSLTAIFELSTSNSYTIIGKPNNDSYGTVEGSGLYQYGESVTLTAVAAAGYRFVNWNDGNTDIDRNIVVTGGAVYIANFVPDGFVMFYTIAGYSNDNNMGTVQGGGSFAENTHATLTAVPVAGYRFIRWSNGSNENPLHVVVTGDASYTAIFATDNPNTPYFDINVISNNTELGTVSGQGSYQYGDEVALVATPTANGKFVMWSDGDTHRVRTVVATGAYTYVANFVSNATEIVYHFATINSSDEMMGNVSGTGRYPHGAVVVATATANSGNVFEGWSNNSTDNPLLITLVSDTTVMAFFDSQAPTETPTDSVFITLLVNDVTMGDVLGSGMYAKGAYVNIIASAKRGYTFLRWSDGNTNAMRTIVATENATYTATFEKVQGIDDIQFPEFQIYTSGRSAFVNVSQPENVYLYSLLGTMINSAYGDNVVFDVPSKGVYMIKVGNAPAQRIVIMH